MTKCLLPIIELRHAVRGIGAHKQHLPSIPVGFDDIGVLRSAHWFVSRGHPSTIQEKLNECKR